MLGRQKEAEGKLYAWVPIECNTMVRRDWGVICWDGAGGVARCCLLGWQLRHSTSQMPSAGMMAGMECWPGVVCWDGGGA